MYFSQTPSELIALKPSRGVLTVYGWLDLRANRQGYWFDSQAAIASACGLSKATVERAVKFLRDGGFIETERQHHTTDILKYTVTRRHRRGQPSSQMRAAALTDEGGNDDRTSFLDHISQQQISTSGSSRRDHGPWERSILRS